MEISSNNKIIINSLFKIGPKDLEKLHEDYYNGKNITELINEYNLPEHLLFKIIYRFDAGDFNNILKKIEKKEFNSNSSNTKNKINTLEYDIEINKLKREIKNLQSELKNNMDKYTSKISNLQKEYNNFKNENIKLIKKYENEIEDLNSKIGTLQIPKKETENYELSKNLIKSGKKLSAKNEEKFEEISNELNNLKLENINLKIANRNKTNQINKLIKENIELKK